MGLLFIIGLILGVFGVIIFYYLYKSLALKHLYPVRGNRTVFRKENSTTYWLGISFYLVMLFFVFGLGLYLMKSTALDFISIPAGNLNGTDSINYIISLPLLLLGILFLKGCYNRYKTGEFFLRKRRTHIYRSKEPALYWLFLLLYLGVGLFLLFIGLRVLGVF